MKVTTFPFWLGMIRSNWERKESVTENTILERVILEWLTATGIFAQKRIADSL